MRGGKSAIPLPLVRAARRFEAWRRSNPLGTRIPPSFWARAVELARTYGVSRTATVLRLNYYDLKKRTQAAGSPSRGVTPPPPAFVELVSSTLGLNTECVIEFENAAGSKMRVQLKGAPIPDLVALGASLWRAEP